jgi:diguanylate cyclase (GGDEF)-like protein
MPSQPGGPAESGIAEHVSGLVPMFTAATPCGRIEEVFRSDPTIRCVVVRSDDGTLGLIMRDRFMHAMAGPFGYGRALLFRQPIGALAEWDPLVVAPDISVDHVCQVLRRRPDNAYDDVLVWYGPDRVGRVSAAAVFDLVARRCADQAGSDPLTSLANRRLFLERLEAACQRARTGECHVVVAFVDLDGMKRINDAQGHDVGDAVLIAAAGALRHAVASPGVVARLGGDEFAAFVLSATADGPVGYTLGERLRAAIAALDRKLAGGLPVRASVGVAVSEERADARTLLTEADAMMYRAKRSGGDAVACDHRPVARS